MKKVFEILTIFTLILWGGAFLYFYFSSRVDLYLKPKFHSWVVIAGFGLILLGLLNLIFIKKETGVCSHEHAGGDDHQHTEDCGHDHHQQHTEDCGHDHHHQHTEDCGHDHHHQHTEDCGHDHHHEVGPHQHDEVTPSSMAFALVVLIVPLLMAAGYSQDKFSGDYTKKWMEIEIDMMRLRLKKENEVRQRAELAAGQNPYASPPGMEQANKAGENGSSPSSNAGEAWGKFTIEDLKKMVPQTSKGDFLLDVPQIFYTAGDQELMDVMEGISVQTEAQIIEDSVKSSKSDRLRAYRLLIECCAADARPLSIPIEFAEAVPDYKEMGWYLLVGRLHFEKGQDNEYTPIMQIKSFEPTVEPADWMTRY